MDSFAKVIEICRIAVTASFRSPTTKKTFSKVLSALNAFQIYWRKEKKKKNIKFCI